MTGYGVVDHDDDHPVYVASGAIRVEPEPFPKRLKQIFDGVSAIVGQYRPDEFAIEQVFMHRNADSALKLGQARGAAICAVLSRDLAVFEYAPRQIKQALVGTGGADKVQVRHMVKVLLGLALQQSMQIDASDALGVALCHAHYRHTARQLRRSLETLS